MSAALFEAYQAIDAALADAGVPRSSEFWVDVHRQFYLHPTATLLVVCAGRGAAKSTQSVRTALVETLFGDFSVPRGERHFYVLISENVSEANKTLRIAEEYLKILRVPYQRQGDSLELEANGQLRGIRVLACRIGAVSGFRCIGWSADECAKYNVEGVNPSAEIIASLNAMTITHPNARRRMISSPMASMGEFYEAHSRGSNEHQLVIGPIASWLANPGAITEAAARKLEPNERIFNREYRGLFSSTAGTIFEEADIEALPRRLHIMTTELSPVVMAVDSSAGRLDGFRWCFAQWVLEPCAEDEIEWLSAPGIEKATPKRDPVTWDIIKNPRWHQPVAKLHIFGMGGYDAEEIKSNSMSLDDLVAESARVARRNHVHYVFGDQFMRFALEGMYSKWSLKYLEQTWSQTSKQTMVASLKEHLRARTLVVQPGIEAKHLQNELRVFEERVTSSGALSYGARKASHDDRVACVMNVLAADAERLISGSPRGISRQRYEIQTT